MNDLSNWQTILDTSATMIGFIFVVMTTLISRREDDRMRVQDARALMFFTVASFTMFIISLGISLYIIMISQETTPDVLTKIGLVYFVLGFLISTLVVGLVISQWIRNTGNQPKNSDTIESNE